MRNVSLRLTTSHVIGMTVNGDFKGSQFANRDSPGRVRLFKFTPQLRFSAKGYEFHTYLALSLWFLNSFPRPFFYMTAYNVSERRFVQRLCFIRLFKF